MEGLQERKKRPEPVLKFLLCAAALVVLVAGLKAAKTLFVPLLLAFFLTVLSLPLLTLLQRWLPRPVSVFLTLLVDVSALAFLGWVVNFSLVAVTRKLPSYQERFQLLTADALGWLLDRGIDLSEWITPESIGPGPLVEVARNTFLGVATLVTVIFIVVLLTTFMLLEASGFVVKVEAAVGGGGVLRRISKITGEVQRYLLVKTLISLATGFSVAIWVAVIGLDFPVLWGVIAFALNYIPNIGSLLAGLPAVGLALVQLSLPATLAVALGYVLVNVLWGSIVEPQVLGRQLRISPMSVFLSLLFWGWVWGPIGMLLAVPVTMILKILFENIEDLRWVAALLDPAPRVSA